MEEFLKKNRDLVLSAMDVAPAMRSYDIVLLLRAWLTRTEFFSKNLAGIANPMQLNDIARYMELRSYCAGDVVFNQGDIGDKVFILFNGSCYAQIRYEIDLTQGDREFRTKKVMDYNTIGQFFGERALQFDEPRTGTVICSTDTVLMTVTKASYVAVLEESKRNPEWKERSEAAKKGQESEKEKITLMEDVMALLAKAREKRTNKELDLVASYLRGRIHFFQKFSMAQLVELCRVAETIFVSDRRILFKQGEVGQAFYVLMSGSVEVWVSNSDAPAKSTPVGYAVKTITRGLGVRVNQLVSGEIFGERALENEDSMRQASIVTAGATELIVITREDYKNFVYATMQGENLKRLNLLRRTALFQSVDVMHLKVLARFMKNKTYNVDKVIYSAGTKATAMIIVESGECRAETEVREGIDHEELARRHRVRYAPHYFQPTLNRDGKYHEGEEGVTPFHEDPYHLKHPELGHQHPTSSSSRVKRVKSERLTPHSTRSEASNFSFADSKHELHVEIDEYGHKVRKPISPLNTNVSRPSITPLNSISTRSKHGKQIMFSEEAIITNPIATVIEDEQQLQSSSTNEPVSPFHSVEATTLGKFERKRHDRLQSSEMIQLGKTKTVNLGRIAPNTVLATYIAAGSLQDDIFHPETVIASTFVVAYVIEKHDFFNHFSRDTHDAMVKLIAAFKAPLFAQSLWENAPRQLDEDLWRKEKTWSVYMHRMLNSQHKDLNILKTFQRFENVHLSANSGNDDFTRINVKNRRLMESRTMRQGGTHVVVTSDWGLRGKHKPIENEEKQVTDEDTEPSAVENNEELESQAANRSSRVSRRDVGRTGRLSPIRDRSRSPVRNESITPPRTGRRQHSVRDPKRQIDDFDILESRKLVQINPGVSPRRDHDVLLHPNATLLPIESENPSANIVTIAVSHMLRNRIKNAAFPEQYIKKELVRAHTPPRGTLNEMVQKGGILEDSSLVESSVGGYDTDGLLMIGDASLNLDSSVQNVSFLPQANCTNYQLIQLHKVATHPAVHTAQRLATESALDERKMVRCYLRLCGGGGTLAETQSLAELQLQEMYSTVLRNRGLPKKELHLQWNDFTGIEHISPVCTDHFIIYQRNKPVSYASIRPSMNIFNIPYPERCVEAVNNDHRFACVLLNPLINRTKSITLSNHLHDHQITKMNPSLSGGKTINTPFPSMSAPKMAKPAFLSSLTIDVPVNDGSEVIAHQKELIELAKNVEGGANEVVRVEKERTLQRIDTAESVMSHESSLSASYDSTDSPSGRSTPSLPACKGTNRKRKKKSRQQHRKGTASESNECSTGEQLSEYDAVNEILYISASKDECLKFTIGHFGQLQDPNALAVNFAEKSVVSGTSCSSSVTIEKMDAKVYLKSLTNTSVIDHGDDRVEKSILPLLHAGTHHVCIFPFFKWMLLNGETIQSFNFLNGFAGDTNAKLMYMQAEYDHSMFSAAAKEQMAQVRLSSSEAKRSRKYQPLVTSQSLDALLVKKKEIDQLHRSLTLNNPSVYNDSCDTLSINSQQSSAAASRHVPAFVSRYANHDSESVQDHLDSRFSKLEHLHRTRFQKVTLDAVVAQHEQLQQAMNKSRFGSEGNGERETSNLSPQHMKLKRMKSKLPTVQQSLSRDGSGKISIGSRGSDPNSGSSRNLLKSIHQQAGAYVVGTVGKRIEQSIQALSESMSEKLTKPQLAGAEHLHSQQRRHRGRK